MRPVVVTNLIELERTMFHRESGEPRPKDDANALLEELANLQTIAYLLNAHSRLPEFPEE
jgi:hypothetical protein